MRYLLLFLFFVASSVKAQQYYSFNQLDSLQKVKEKKVLIFVHTDWCSYCKGMEEVVFKDTAIVSLLAGPYYLIKLNAEEKQPIVYRNRKFIFNPSLGFHELAILLAANSKLSFPALYILDNQNQLVYQCQEFINSKDLRKVLHYFKGKN